MKRRIRAWRKGKVETEEMEASVAAWLGHAEHANTYNLQRELLGGTGLI